MPPIEFLGILILCVAAWAWLDSVKAREIAVAAAREACALEGVMLLDDTVALSAMRLAREEDGRMKLQRAYAFEYSDTGNNRRPGSVVLRGRRVLLFNVGLRETPRQV